MIWIISLLGFLLMGLDKQFAKKRLSRIPEATFVFISLIGGFVGIYVGAHVFSHKTQKKSFQIKNGLAFILFLVIMYLYRGKL